MAIIALRAHFDMARTMGVMSKFSKKCRSTVKTVSKNIQMVKSCGQNKFVNEISNFSKSTPPYPDCTSSVLPKQAKYNIKL
jgi:hypothetical protein